jgi:hypothetical protein
MSGVAGVIDGGSAGAGKGASIAPREHICFDVCDTGLFRFAQLYEAGAAPFASPKPKSRGGDADQRGSFIIVEDIDRLGHSIHSEEKCRRLFWMVTRPDELSACARGTKREFHPPACPVASLEFSSWARPSAARLHADKREQLYC